MINWGSIPPEKHELVLRRRLEDLFEDPSCRFIHFDIVEGMYGLNLTKYQYKGRTIRLNDDKDAFVIVSV
jgi:hypothetical protein